MCTFTGTSTSQQPKDESTQQDSLFFRLPAELRLMIYEDLLEKARCRPLYIHRHMWSWKRTQLRQKKAQNCHRLLLICRRIKEEVLEILYKRHELQLYTTTAASLNQDKTRKRICGIEQYENHLRDVHKLCLRIIVPNEAREQRALIALMVYLKAILAERQRPLEVFTIEFCATDARSCRPSAVLYAAQGFRSLGRTKFEFQSGFSGSGSENARRLLEAELDAKDQTRKAEMSREEALVALDKAWSCAQPDWYNPRVISNRWLGTTLEV